MAEIKIMTAMGDKIYRSSELPVLSLKIKRDENAADMLELHLAGQIRDFPTFLRVYLGNELVFDGITDDLICVRTEDKDYTELVARDMFSLLTDNELRPCSLRNPSLRLFEERFLMPLGFEIRGNRSTFRGEMLIKEGCSVFRGLSDFCGNFMGIEPFRRGNVIYCGGEIPSENFTETFPVIYRERKISRYGVASKLYVRNSQSSLYTACRENSEDLGYTRCVYGEGSLEPEVGLEICLGDMVNIVPGDSYDTKLRVQSVRINFDGVSWNTRISGKELVGGVDA